MRIFLFKSPALVEWIHSFKPQLRANEKTPNTKKCPASKKNPTIHPIGDTYTNASFTTPSQQCLEGAVEGAGEAEGGAAAGEEAH